MHSVKILTLILLLHWTKNGEATKTNYELSKDNNNELQKALILNHDRELRGFKDVWNNIKKSVVKAWNFFKSLAENTKQKLNIWIENVKKRANDLTNEFKDHMRKLKDNINNWIKRTFGNSTLVKMCLEEEAPEMDRMIKQIMKDVTACITNNVRKPSLLGINLLNVNDTKFFKDLEERMKLCENNLDNAEDCLNKVRQDNFNDIQDKETDIIQSRVETRNILDNTLAALVSCSIEGLLEASSIITSAAVKITKCILKPKY